ncbi:MAG: xlnA 3 [Actinomycetia bacterium]|nr:xlnA 3 [Actinomycetes bacterium]
MQTRRGTRPAQLGTGGDDSNGSDGSFFEGVITGGYPSTGTDNAIQASIVAAGCQHWTFTSAGNGHYIITNVASGTVLDSVDCGIFVGTLTDLWTSLGNTCQQWDLTP